MKLSKIEVAGFRGVRSELSVAVPDGFLIVSGRNGSGKSTLFDAVEFALCGKVSRPALASEDQEDINDYIWWRGPGEAPSRYVALEFIDEVGRVLRLSRGRDSFRASLADASEVDTEIDPEDVHQLFGDSSSPEGGLLERICATTILRDEQITELSVDAPERERFSLLRDTLGSTRLPAVEERLKDARQYLDSQVRRLDSAYERGRAEVTRLLARVSEMRSELESQPDAEAARRDLASATGEAADVAGEVVLQRARARIAELRRTISVTTRCLARVREISENRDRIATEAHLEQGRLLSTRLEDAKSAFSETESAVEAAETSVREFEDRQPLVRSLAELHEHGSRLGLDDGRCPLCGSEVSPDDFEAHKRIVAERVALESEDLAGALAAREVAWAARTDAVSARRAAEEDLRNHTGLLEDLEAQWENVQAEVRDLSSLLQPAEINSESLDEALQDVRSKLMPIESALSAIEASSAFDRLVSEERLLEQARNEVEGTEKSLDSARRAADHCRQASRVVRRVAGELVDERLAQLEPLLLELYGRLRPHAQWTSVGYKVRGDVRRFLRLTVGEDELNPRFMFSSGQRRALGLAFLLSVHLSTTWSRWNTLILDDPMQHVDDYRALQLVEALAAIRKAGRQVLCAVEDPSLARLLARRLATTGNEVGATVELAYEVGSGSTIAQLKQVPPLAPRLISAA